MNALPRISLLAVAVALAAPAAAPAATLEFSATAGPAAEDFLSYKAGRHERNRLTVTAAKRTITFSDPGARIRRRGDYGQCSYSRDRHRAVCRANTFTAIIASLGDRNDSIRFGGRTAPRLGPTARTEAAYAAQLGDRYGDTEGGLEEHALVIGGPGDDRLTGTKLPDHILPGPGRDRVDTGGGYDRIGIEPDGKPDVLRGGRDVDTIDAVGEAPVSIDLTARTLTAGTDIDSLDSLERARGGAGDDTLVGTEGADGLFGDGGRDTLDGRGGGDYLGGDLGQGFSGLSGGAPGVDSLGGGAGDDVLDGRDAGDGLTTPTDTLTCGDGSDRILAREDDLADRSCESSGSGVLSAYLYNQFGSLTDLSGVQPVARGEDGAPTYSIGCYGGYSGTTACAGRVQLERPPVAGSTAPPEVLGSGEFTIAPKQQANVQVTLNAAGKAALAQPGARVSVHVLMGESAKPGGPGPRADFGWQQVLGQ